MRLFMHPGLNVSNEHLIDSMQETSPEPVLTEQRHLPSVNDVKRTCVRCQARRDLVMGIWGARAGGIPCFSSGGRTWQLTSAQACPNQATGRRESMFIF